MATILVAEDDDQVRVLAESYLREQGHHTVSAASIDEALAAFDLADAVDLLFTDIVLKGDLDAGLELAKQALARKPEIKVLYTTGQAITDGMRAMMVDGSAVLEKPYTVDQLQAAMSVHFGIKPEVVQPSPQ